MFKFFWEREREREKHEKGDSRKQPKRRRIQTKILHTFFCFVCFFCPFLEEKEEEDIFTFFE
jgi:hypothetical protein